MKNLIALFLLFVMLQAWAQDANEQLAAQYFSDKDYEKAGVLYEELFNKKPTPFYYAYYLDCLLALSEYKTAEKVIKKQIKDNPGIYKYQVDLGYVYLKTGEDEKATIYFQGIIDDLPADQEDITGLANAFQTRGMLALGISTYLKGRQLVKQQTVFSAQLGDLYLRNGNARQMVQEYLNVLEMGSGYMPDIQAKLQLVLGEESNTGVASILQTELLARAQQHTARSVYSEMLVWLFVQEKKFDAALKQAVSIDKRLKQDGSEIMDLAHVCVSNKEYQVAVACYDYILSKGADVYHYGPARVARLKTRFLSVTQSLRVDEAELMALALEYNQAIAGMGMTTQAIQLIKNLAHLEAFYLHNIDKAVALLEDAVQIYASPQIQAECKIELADILLMSGHIWDATLLYSQVDKAFKDDLIGHIARFKNAKLSYYIGEFNWAKAQLDVLRAATSKLIANDAMDLSLLISDNIGVDSSEVALHIFARADLLSLQNKDSLALTTLDSIGATIGYHSLADEVLFKKASIMIKRGLYQQAVNHLQDIVDVYVMDILADDALFTLALLYEEQFSNKEKAMACYEQLLKEFPGSLYVVEARKRYRKLRGDQLN